MSNINFFYYNFVTQSATDTSATSENAQFPLSNLKLPFSTKVFRSTAASDSVVFDFKTISEIDSILVRSNSTGSWGHGNLTIEANATDSWGAPAYSTTLTVDTDWEVAYKLLASSESYRFWRVTGTGSSYFELSNIFFGTKYIPGTNIIFDWKFDDKDNSSFTKNRYGQKFIDVLNNNTSYSMAIKLFDKDVLDSLNAFFGYVGKREPFWMVMDVDELFSNDSELFAGQFYFMKRPAFSNPHFGIYSTSMRLEECI